MAMSIFSHRSENSLLSEYAVAAFCTSLIMVDYLYL